MNLWWKQQKLQEPKSISLEDLQALYESCVNSNEPREEIDVVSYQEYLKLLEQSK